VSVISVIVKVTRHAVTANIVSHSLHPKRTVSFRNKFS
jgi:hypothetical protein